MIRKHLRTDRWEAVLITADAAALQTRLAAATEPPYAYPNPVEAATQAEDPAILATRIAPTKVEVVPVAQVFEK